MQLLIKDPGSPALQFLWADILQASVEVDCDLVYNDAGVLCADDEAGEDPFDFIFDE